MAAVYKPMKRAACGRRLRRRSQSCLRRPHVAAYGHFVRQPAEEIMHRLTTIFLLSLTVPALPVFAQGSTTSCAHSPSADTTVFALDEVTEMPIRRRMEPPRLPPAFFRMKVNVQVMLSFIVNKDGTVDTSSVVVVEPQGSALESEAVRVVKKATFSPACRDHNAVRVRVQIPMHFVR